MIFMNWSCFVKLFNDKINVDYGLKQVVEHTQINWEDWWFWCLLQLKCSLREKCKTVCYLQGMAIISFWIKIFGGIRVCLLSSI